MCGIVGVASSERLIGALKRMDFFQQGLYCDALRGWDSTGIAAIKDNDTSIIKRAIQASDFIDTKRVDKLLIANTSAQFLIGHNRKATMGSMGHEGAHPFQYGDITMVHNGTLYSHDELPNGKKFAIDSEAICNAINEIGIAETVKLLDGAFALVWHDKSDNTLNFIRNDKREFAFGMVKHDDTLLFASEMGMLEWLADRNNMVLEGVFSLTPEYHVKIHADKVQKYSAKKLEMKPDYWSGYYGSGAYQKDYATGKPANQSLTVRDSATKKLLEDYSLAIDDEIEFYPHSWQSYSGQQNRPKPFGKLKGWTMPGKGEDCLEIEVHSVLEDEFDIDGDTLLSGSIISARAGVGKLDLDILIVRGVVEIVDETPVESGNTGPSDESTEVFEGPNNKFIPLKEWNQLTKHGCSYCTDNLLLKEAPLIKWVDTTTPVCGSCWAKYQADPAFDTKAATH